MIIKCCFCDYNKEARLNEDMLKILSEKDLPHEDYLLWMKRLFSASIYNVLNGVKIHMGRKHPKQTFYGIMPDFELSRDDKSVLNEQVRLVR